MTDRRILAALAGVALGYAAWRVRKLELAWHRLTVRVQRGSAALSERLDVQESGYVNAERRIVSLEQHLRQVEQWQSDANQAAAEHDAAHAQADASYVAWPDLSGRLDALKAELRDHSGRGDAHQDRLNVLQGHITRHVLRLDDLLERVAGLERGDESTVPTIPDAPLRKRIDGLDLGDAATSPPGGSD